MANSLPVYRLSYAETDFSQTVNLAQNLFRANDNFEMAQLKSGGHLVSNSQFTLETANGGLDIWASDKVQRWNPSIRPNLLKESEAINAVNKIVQEKKLLPSLQKPFEYAKPQVGGTYFSVYQNKKRENHQLDTQIVYPMLVNGLPIVGGRGDFMVSLGDKGQLTGFSGGGIAVSDSFNVEVFDKKYAEGVFREITKSLNVETFDSYLAYHAGHVFDKQEYLYPVMVFRASIKIGKEKIALRNIIVPATDFGPKPQKSIPQSKRNANSIRVKDITEKSKMRRNYEARSLLLVNPWEAGTSWIGESGGLAGSKANAQGFVDEWRSAGWKINFNWGDSNAWESDWRSNDDSWVDAADFVFYTGHANMNGWVLASPDDGFLNFSEIGNAPQTPGDLWGQNDLEWAIIAACGPLQDEILYAGGGDVLSRWDGIFDGMHILMGYGGVTFDNSDEGRKVSQYAKQGNTLIQSWFRAAQEIQPATNGYPAPDGPNIYVGAMWASKDGADPYNDHAWGYGSVSNDPTSPTSLSAMWTLC